MSSPLPRVRANVRRAAAWALLACIAALLTGCGRKPDARQASPTGQGEEARKPPKDGMGKTPPGGKDRPGEKPPGTETHTTLTDNPFRTPARDPMATFSVDVDTAPYSRLRRTLLEEGRLPKPDSVQLAGLVNYFPYDYPPAEAGQPVSCTLDLAQCPWNERHLLARVGLRAYTIPADRMPPRNFVFLVDTSGSMDAPNRLPLLKQSLLLLVEQLTERDRVSVVTYAGSAGLALGPTPGSDKEPIRRAIDRLEAAGSTAGGEGIVLAYRVAEQSFIRDGVNRILLGTDGDFNVGLRGEALVQLIDEKRRSGVFLTVLGFGMGNVKNHEMEELAHHGNGHYAYIDTEAEAKKVFVDQGAALLTVAKDVKVQVEFNPHKVGAYRLLGYENRMLSTADFTDDSKDAGDLGSGHTVTAFFEIVPAGQPINLPGVTAVGDGPAEATAPTTLTDEWCVVKLRYKDPDGEVSREFSRSLKGEVLPPSAVPVDFRFAAAVAEFGLLLRASPYRGAASYGHVREAASAALGPDVGGYRREFLRLVDAAEKLSAK